MSKHITAADFIKEYIGDFELTPHQEQILKAMEGSERIAIFTARNAGRTVNELMLHRILNLALSRYIKKLEDGIIQVIKDIQAEILKRPKQRNIGKIGCVMRLKKLLEEMKIES